MSKWIGPAILGLFGVVILCGLGIWQMERLAWKEGLIAELEAHMNAEPVSVGEIDLTNMAELNGTPVVADGHFTDQYFDILSGGADGAGYRRVHGFDTSGGARILVELGFLPEAETDAAFALPQGEVEIQGHIYAPKLANGIYDAGRNIWIGYDVPKMADQLGAEPLVLAAARSPIPELADTPMTIDLPNNHLQYAITWFLLALAWAGMALYWGIRRSKEEN